MIIIGGGEFTERIENTKDIEFFKISGTKTKSANYAGYNLKNIENIKIPKGNNQCIINWSYTFIKNFDQLKLAIKGIERISRFMVKNSDCSYIFISSTSANLDLNYNSLYGIYKFLSEKILKDVSINEGINFNIVRLGMLYGTKNCPIKKIYKYRKYGLMLIPGNLNAEFAVTSADEVIEKLVNPESEIWFPRKNESYFIDPQKVTFKYIHKIFNKKCKSKKRLIALRIRNQGLIHKLSNFFGKKIDLSLSEVNRYPRKIHNIKNTVSSFEKYISEI